MSIKFDKRDFEHKAPAAKRYPPPFPGDDAFIQMETPVRLVSARYEQAKRKDRDDYMSFGLQIESPGHVSHGHVYTVNQFIKPDFRFVNGQIETDADGHYVLDLDENGDEKYTHFTKKMGCLLEAAGEKKYDQPFENATELAERLNACVKLNKEKGLTTPASRLFVASIKAWWYDNTAKNGGRYQVYQLGFVKLYEPGNWGQGKPTQTSKKLA